MELKMRPSFWLILIVLTLLPTLAMAELRVVATTGDLAAAARAILGDDGHVDVLVRPAEDPHFVEPRPSFVRLVARADMVAYVGMDLEIGWLPTLITGSRNPKVQAGQPGDFNASRHVVARDVATGRVDRSMGDVHAAGNPHYTTEPRQMARIAIAMGQALGQLEPAKAEVFRERARNLARECIRLAQTWEARFAEIPEERRQFVSYHAAWSYVANWLALEDVAQIEPKPGIGPNPRHVAHVVRLIEERKVPVIIQLDYYPVTTGNLIADRTPAKLLVLPAQTRENETYIEHIGGLAAMIYEVLRGQ
jgi:zinc/manganese transport system substrate-binding protein